MRFPGLQPSLAAALALAGCGRIAFTSTPPLDGSTDAGRDAVDASDGGGVAPNVDGGILVAPGGLALGTDHSCARFGDTIVCTGDDTDGELGLGDTTARGVFTTSTALSPAIALGAGYNSTCVLRASGVLECVGDNTSGQLGAGDFDVHTTPVAVALGEAVIRFDTRFAHACAVLASGALGCWGSNDEAELGLSGDSDGVDQATPVAVTLPEPATDTCVGQGHSCAVGASGSAYCWGRNVNGEAGVGTTDARVWGASAVITDVTFRAIECGQNQTLAIDTAGRLFGWGEDTASSGGAGAIGFPDARTALTPELVDDGGVWEEVAIDTFHGCGIRDGALLCWGRNVEGQLGLGDTTDREVATQVGTDTDWAHASVGRFFSCAQKDDGSVWCTGAEGALGTGDASRRSSFTRVAP